VTCNETSHTGSLEKENGHNYINMNVQEVLNDHTDQSTNDVVKEEEIEFHKGWEPQHYELVKYKIL
jgi:hypothetical protein